MAASCSSNCRRPEPFVLPNALKSWPEVSKVSPETIPELLTGEELFVRFGPLLHEPGTVLHETEMLKRYLTVRQFLDWAEGRALPKNTMMNDVDRRYLWGYMDYKYLSEVAAVGSDCDLLKLVDWSVFGVAASAFDSSLWIGTDGAFTPCHYDSYGFNLHAQIYGHKRWVLFPPEDSALLEPTRLPYEDSSVFSGVDVLGVSDKLSAASARVVTLSPGDVLYVPPGWWHFVQCKDLCISVNTWVPVREDEVSGKIEVITKALVSLFACGHLLDTSTDLTCSMVMDTALSVEADIAILNEESIRRATSEDEPATKKKRTDEPMTTEPESDYGAHDRFLNRFADSGVKLDVITFAQLQKEILGSSARSSPDRQISDCETRSKRDLLKTSARDLLNAILHPDVVLKIAEVLQK